MPTTGRQIVAALRHLLGAATPPPDPAPLEDRLLSRFDALQTPETLMTPRSWLRTSAVAAGLLVAAAAASQAPADFAAEIGKRIEIRSPAPLGPEAVRAAVEALRGGALRLRVEVRVERRGDGPVLTRIDLWGDTAGMQEVDRILRRAVPALAGADITVSGVEGTVHGNVGGAVARLLGRRDLSPDQLAEAIRREVQKAEPGAQVDVNVEREGDRERVEVRARKTEERAP
jgi:hypothetical protein